MKLGFFRVLRWFGFPVKEAGLIYHEATSVHDFESWQNQKKWEILKFHFSHNMFYQNLAGSLPSTWESVPVLKRADLKGDYLMKIPDSYRNKKLYKGNTSGSSGNMLFFAQDMVTHCLVWHHVANYFSKAGLSIDDRQARLFGMSYKTTSYFQSRIKDFISNRYRFNIFDLSDEAFQSWIHRFKKDKFHYLYGYTNSLVAFAQYLIRQDLRLVDISPTLKACITTSEVCTDGDTEIMRQGFGIKVINEYGSSELGVMGVKTDGYWEGSDSMMYLEVLDEAGNILPDGQVGILTCTSLYNRATPFIRYQPGDLASISRKDGRTKIHEVMGSLNDMAVLPSGKKVPGISFYFVAQDLIESSHKIKEFLFRQSPEHFIFEYVADADMSKYEFDKIKRGFDLHIEKDIPLVARRVEKLTRGKNGKFKHFISCLNNDNKAICLDSPAHS
jgi:phenylacetate-CoA ligase